MARKTSSKHKKELYQSYKSNGTYEKNRLSRLKRHLKNHPEDAQAQKALSGGITYRRKRPVSWNKTWSPINREIAQSFRKAGLNGNLALKPRAFMIIK